MSDSDCDDIFNDQTRFHAVTSNQAYKSLAHTIHQANRRKAWDDRKLVLICTCLKKFLDFRSHFLTTSDENLFWLNRFSDNVSNVFLLVQTKEQRFSEGNLCSFYALLSMVRALISHHLTDNHTEKAGDVLLDIGNEPTNDCTETIFTG